MAFYQKKKKPRPLTKEEQAYVDEKLNAYKKFFKPLKGEIVYKRDDCSQEVVFTARYDTEDDIKHAGEEAVARMNELDSGKHWSLMSWRVLSKSTLDDVDERRESTEG